MISLKDKSAIWLGPVVEPAIVAAEEVLSQQMPKSYRRFLLQYGSGIIDGHELYGLGGPDTVVPSLLWLVADLRSSGLQRPPQLIPFHAEGDGAYSAVLAAPLNGQPTGAVVYWSPRRDAAVDFKPGYASLGDWFKARGIDPSGL